MVKRTNYAGWGKHVDWEQEGARSRVVTAEDPSKLIFVSGCTATDGEGNVVGVGDPYAQAVQALNNIKQALEMAGASMKDVVRTRVFVTDLRFKDDVNRAYREFFGDVLPVRAMIGATGFMLPEMLLEIEADAVV
ncbi:MAG: Rid family hydrolase [Dehalococcoidia bacterium]